MNPQHRWMRVCGLAGLAVLLSSLEGVQAANGGEILLPWDAAERPIAVGEVHVRQITVKPDSTLLITVDQHSIDLVIEARGSALSEPITVAAGNDRWGAEVLLLKTPGEYRIEIRPKKKSAWPGHYTVQTADLPAASQSDARRDALAWMSQAGQEAFRGTPESRRQAKEAYRRALVAWHDLEEPAWEAEALTCIALLENASDELQPATEDLLAAASSWGKLSEPRREAEALNWLGRIYPDTQGPEKAREALKRALTLWRQLGERFDEAETTNNLCFVDGKLGAYQEALTCFQGSLALYRELGIQEQEAAALQNLGYLNDVLGNPDEALALNRQALDLWRALGDSREFEVLNNIAKIRRSLGEWQEALRLYGEALERLPPGEDWLKATLLNNIGYAYDGLGEPERAILYYEDAGKLLGKMGDRSGEITNLNNRGSSSRKLGDLKKALDLHQQALQRAIALHDSVQQATSRERMADVYLDQGNVAEALRQLEEAARLRQTSGDRAAETGNLYRRGQALVLAGRPGEARPLLEKVLERHRAVRDSAGEAQALFALATAERSLGLAQQARAHAQESVARVEALRLGFSSPDLRASFLASRQRSYSLLIDLLMDQNAAEPGKGHDRKAFAVSEQARARSLLDGLGGATFASSTAPGELGIRRRILLSRQRNTVDQLWKQSGEPARALQKELDAILSDLDVVEAEIRRHDSRAAAATAARPAAIEEVSSWLEPGTMLAEYSLGESRSFLFTLESIDGKDRLRTYILPARHIIETRARKLHEELSKITSEASPPDSRKAADSLAQTLLGPIWDGDAARLHRLVVVPDGALGILPFAALRVPDPGAGWTPASRRQPLLEHLEVVSIPSAMTLGLQRQRSRKPRTGDKLAAILADPVFAADDVRLARKPAALRSGAVDFLQPLPATKKEARAIASLASTRQGVRIWLGTETSREAVLSGELRDYRILHFATHARADTQNPERSGLFLSQVDAEGRPIPGFLSLSDIYELDLDADLVVLSGCGTALGKEIRGEGLMGLTRSFQYAGVPRVVASLWPVEEHATAELMIDFYRAMWREGLPAAAALRKAQIKLRKSYRDPHSWAAFVLQGDWTDVKNGLR